MDLEKLKEILSDDKFRYLYLVSLISSDTIVDAESGKKSLEKLSYLKEHLDELELEDAVKNDIKKFVKDGIKIAKRDISIYEKGSSSH